MQLVWAENIVRKEAKPVLVITPLSVSQQTLKESEKFGIECSRSKDGKHNGGIVITNYERLHYFDPDDFIGVVCDESSILKNFKGATKAAITEFMRTLKYRLLCTATAAPNDYIELGTSSESLGELGYMSMLGMFFKNSQNSLNPMRRQDHSPVQWHLKANAEEPFWRWVCSWARSCRKPSDLGFDDDRFTLPDLQTHEEVVRRSKPLNGMLFDFPAVTLHEQREERRATINERCESVASKVADTRRPAVVWAHLNDECDILDRIIPDGVQVSGKHSDEQKEEYFEAFQNGEIRVLITKPQIGSFGLNWQHCSHMTFFPSHSFEQFYQGVRRCWRFGQKNTVRVDIVTSEGERGVLENLKRKARAADQMFDRLVHHMDQSLKVNARTEFPIDTERPQWLV